MNPQFSIIIPLDDQENQWKFLLQDLKRISDQIEIILVVAHRSKVPLEIYLKKNFKHYQIIKTQLSRSIQLNQGAKKSKTNWLWFLHADSRVTHQLLEELLEIIKKNQDEIYFFQLVFQSPKSWLKINTKGCWLRSNLLKLPFGDQGFLMKKNIFHQLKGYNESLKIAEDYDLIWKAHFNHIKVTGLKSYLTTSARKYSEKGWLKLTLFYFSFWTPIAVKNLMRMKLKK